VRTGSQVPSVATDCQDVDTGELRHKTHRKVIYPFEKK
jgi:hypothetical protein